MLQLNLVGVWCLHWSHVGAVLRLCLGHPLAWSSQAAGTISATAWSVGDRICRLIYLWAEEIRVRHCSWSFKHASKTSYHHVRGPNTIPSVWLLGTSWWWKSIVKGGKPQSWLHRLYFLLSPISVSWELHPAPFKSRNAKHGSLSNKII